MQAFNSLQRFQPQALALLRIVTALIFIAHGTQKLLGWPIPPMGGNFPAMFSMYWFAGALELVGGILILVGFATRPVAFILSGEMAVAYWIGHAKINMSPSASLYPVANGGDAAILYCFIFLYLVFAGAGAFSIDNRTRA